MKSLQYAAIPGKFALLILLLVTSGNPLEAATEYHVGSGQTYTTLNALFTAVPIFANNDVIILHDAVDDSVREALLNNMGNKTVTIRAAESLSNPAVIAMKISDIPPASYPLQGGILKISGNNATLVLEGVTFTGGEVRGNNMGGIPPGQGGAICSTAISNLLSIQSDSGVIFEGNKAIGGDASVSGSDTRSSGLGGAISAGFLNFSGSGNYLFTNNEVTGGDASNGGYTYGSGHGGGIYAGTLNFSGSGSYLFTNNEAIGGNATNGGDANNSSRAGAIYANDLFFDGPGNYTFDRNKAKGGDASGSGSRASSSGYGGAILASQTLSFSGNGNYLFTNNEAIGGNASNGGDARGSGRGGAIDCFIMSLNFSGSGSYLFMNNEAIGGNADDGGNTSDSGLGGAILCSLPIPKFDGSGNYLFEGNKAKGGNASGSGSNAISSGRGGAITGSNVSGSGNYRFTNNEAIGGNASNGGNSSYSGHGGAIYRRVHFDGQGKYTFEGNKAIGGLADGSSSAAASGLGGAIYTSGVLNIQTGATFINNRASTFTTGEMTSGLGGAIFFDTTISNTFTLKAVDTVNGAVMFQGNTMNPGNTGAIPNSIYFGNFADNNDNMIDAAFHVEKNAKFWMLDPMASQEDNLQDLGGTVYRNIDLTLNKTGPGTWVLAGHNDMRSETDWRISEGKLWLVCAPGTSKPAHIDLSHTYTAKFTLKSGTGLIVEPGLSPHKITGLNISLDTGSTSEVAGFQYGAILDPGEHILLTLESTGGGTLDNRQETLQATDGTVTVGAYNYKYELLRWERDGHDLVFNVLSKTLDPEKGGTPAITGPDEIFIRMYNPVFDAFDQRGKGLFGACRDYRFGWQSRERNNLWATPAYLHASRSKRGDIDGFDLKTTAVSFGYDRHFGQFTFFGVGASVGRPEYSAGKTNIKADDFTIALYGGTKTIYGAELTGRVGYGYAQFRQVRGVEDEYYGSHFNGHSFFTGLGLSRLYSLSNPRFCLRPGINYDFIRLMSDGFHEKEGAYALHIDNHSLNVHRLKAGVDFQWQPVRWFQASTEVYYLGLLSERTAQADAYFINDEANHFTSVANPIAADNLGLGMQLRLPFDNGWELSSGYTALLGANTTSQQAALTAVWKF